MKKIAKKRATAKKIKGTEATLKKDSTKKDSTVADPSADTIKQIPVLRDMTTGESTRVYITKKQMDMVVTQVEKKIRKDLDIFISILQKSVMDRLKAELTKVLQNQDSSQ